MSQCGVNIPLTDVAEAIINEYGDAFATEVMKHLDLGRFVTVEHGTASDLTLRGSLTVDEGVKHDLCSILSDCIRAKFEDIMGCARDTFVTSFKITEAKTHVLLTLNSGAEYSISRNDLLEFLDVSSAGGGVVGGRLDIMGSGEKLITLDNKDGTHATVDVSKLGEAVAAEVADNVVTRGEVVNSNTLRLHRATGKPIDIDASELASTGSPYIVSGVFGHRDAGYWLDFTRNDKTTVAVNMTDFVNGLTTELFNRVMNAGYRINTQESDYTLTGDDFNGRTIVRANKDEDQTITVVKPSSEDFIGKAVIVRKTNGMAGTFVTLVAGEGVSLLPEDATLVRRLGSTVALVYIGNGVYDISGELP